MCKLERDVSAGPFFLDLFRLDEVSLTTGSEAMPVARAE